MRVVLQEENYIDSEPQNKMSHCHRWRRGRWDPNGRHTVREGRRVLVFQTWL